MVFVMSNSDPNLDSIGLGIMGGAVVTALLDHLVEKGILTMTDVRSILTTASKHAGKGNAPAGLHAAQLISAILRRFPEGNGDKRS